MLGYVVTDGRGTSDRLIAESVSVLKSEGWPVLGVVQRNLDRGGNLPCHMDLCVIGTDSIFRISQDLGQFSRGCRLDPSELERAAGLIERALEDAGETSLSLLVVNKFGKQEVDGRGFRSAIGRALADGIPVLTAVNGRNLASFISFAEDLAEPVEPTLEGILAWCRRVTE